MNNEHVGKADANSARRELQLLWSGMGLVLLASGYMAVLNGRATNNLQVRIDRAAGLAGDIRSISSSRGISQKDTPQLSGSTNILDAINFAMESAGMEAKELVSAQPRATRPIHGTDIAEVEYDLIFDDLSLDSLVRLIEATHSRTFKIDTTGINLRASAGDRWSVDWVVTAREGPPAR